MGIFNEFLRKKNQFSLDHDLVLVLVLVVLAGPFGPPGGGDSLNTVVITSYVGAAARPRWTIWW